MVEYVSCKNCGSSVPLGTPRCPYCKAMIRGTSTQQPPAFQPPPVEGVFKIAGEAELKRKLEKITIETPISTGKWLAGLVKSDIQSKTAESIFLVIAAIVLGALGFVWAALGIIFFVAFLYLPGEAEVMARARQQAEGLPGNILLLIRDIQSDIEELEAQRAEAVNEEEKNKLANRIKQLKKRKTEAILKAYKLGVGRDVVELAKSKII